MRFLYLAAVRAESAGTPLRSWSGTAYFWTAPKDLFRNHECADIPWIHDSAQVQVQCDVSCMVTGWPACGTVRWSGWRDPASGNRFLHGTDQGTGDNCHYRCLKIPVPRTICVIIYVSWKETKGHNGFLSIRRKPCLYNAGKEADYGFSPLNVTKNNAESLHWNSEKDVTDSIWENTCCCASGTMTIDVR